MPRTTFALVTHEPLGEHLAGPAIRTLELGRALARDVRTIVCSPAPSRTEPTVEFRQYRFSDGGARLRDALGDADAVLIQGFTLFKFPWLAQSDLPLVSDLYCPFHLENLERRRLVERDEATRRHAAAIDRDVVLQQLRRCDYFICASDRQRDYWLGMLTAAGRLDPSAYDADPDAGCLVGVVPFGLDAHPPRAHAPSLKGVTAGIGATDRVVLWGGSVTDWQDPLTAVRAIARLATSHPDVRLVFPAGIPSPEVPPMAALAQARSLAAGEGLLDTRVFFVPWVRYEDRADYLLESSAGVSAAHPSLETRYAWRTRVLDYLWARLPIVCTRGDSLAELVERQGLGVVVAPGDDGAMAAALARVLDDAAFSDACVQRIEAIVPSFHWDRVVAPLRRFAIAPRRAAAPAAAPAPAGRRISRVAAALGWRRS